MRQSLSGTAILLISSIVGVLAWGVILIFSPDGWPAIIEAAPKWLGVWFGSVTVGLIVTVLNLAVALPAAKVLSRVEWKGKPTIPAYFLFVIVLLAFALTMLGTYKGPVDLVLMVFIPTIPISIFILTYAYQSIGKEMVEQASTLGASPIQVFWTITLPLLRPVIEVVSLLVFFTAVGQSLLIWWLEGGRALGIPVLFHGLHRKIATVCLFLFVASGTAAIIWMWWRERQHNSKRSQGEGCG
ncbi:ABC transporter permease [Polycladomyces subterraneus]|uniref:ABC transporter permease subunit n=1 Tax=Polycladomyces subterraneus TaxID=1016997 RepID=A0ABT8ILN5_9BACL|nr:ABC transporter permease subunit [Polycladomyces subterraneus]MDN4593674.1 ABC transporter permease subunit [Polycladomyces subterraneus]